MNSIFTGFLYLITAILLIISYRTNKHKTIRSIKRAWNMFIHLLPQFLSILFMIGFLLAIISPETIQDVIGSRSGFTGMLFASILGSVTLVPVLIAFPIAAKLLQNGAGIMQIAVFIGTLTTVGLVTLPLERKFLGNKLSILRNLLFYMSSFVVALLMGGILS